MTRAQTFVFTDMEGSTRLAHELGAAWPGLLRTHREILLADVPSAGGRLVHTDGDGCFLVFDEAGPAIAALVAAQRRLAATTWPEGATVRVRIGVHVGTSEEDADGDLAGVDIHEASRVGAAANGGQILLTVQAAEPAEASLPTGAELLPLGRYLLKDFAEARALFAVVIDGLPSTTRTPRAVPEVRHSLPHGTTSFVGRSAAAADVARLLRMPGTVTLRGPGGSGKTRLAIEAAREVFAELAGGAWFIDLGERTPADDLAGAVAAAIPIVPPSAGEAAVAAVARAIAGTPTLLVLDCCEHVADAVRPLVDTWVERCGALRILATSRRAVGVRGERIVDVPPLPADDARSMFLDRAGPSAAAWDETDLAAVDDICRRLDGMPLAIELAAGRLRLLTPTEIASRLEKGTRLLRRADGPARQRSLDAAIAWSYDQASPAAQAVFRRLAVFRGAFGLAAAEDVVPLGDLDRDLVADQLDELVDVSLVGLHTAQRPRFRLLDTLRQFGEQRLIEEGEVAAVVASHDRWFNAYTGRLAASLPGIAHVTTMASTSPDGAVDDVDALGRSLSTTVRVVPVVTKPDRMRTVLSDLLPADTDLAVLRDELQEVHAAGSVVVESYYYNLLQISVTVISADGVTWRDTENAVRARVHCAFDPARPAHPDRVWPPVVDAESVRREVQRLTEVTDVLDVTVAPERAGRQGTLPLVATCGVCGPDPRDGARMVRLDVPSIRSALERGGSRQVGAVRQHGAWLVGRRHGLAVVEGTDDHVSVREVAGSRPLAKGEALWLVAEQLDVLAELAERPTTIRLGRRLDRLEIADADGRPLAWFATDDRPLPRYASAPTSPNTVAVFERAALAERVTGIASALSEGSVDIRLHVMAEGLALGVPGCDPVTDLPAEVEGSLGSTDLDHVRLGEALAGWSDEQLAVELREGEPLVIRPLVQPGTPPRGCDVVRATTMLAGGQTLR